MRRSTTALSLAALAVTVGTLLAAEHTADSLQTVKESIEAETAVLVDVREKSEWDAGHVEGAVSLPLSELKDSISGEDLAERLSTARVIYAHCASGKRCLAAADILTKLGYEVRPLKPGYKQLIDAGFKQADE
jgi:rhodanese-related sulfurtransferase